MKLVYTGTQIRNAERPYLEAPDYDGYLMQRAADALAAEASTAQIAARKAKEKREPACVFALALDT